MHTRGILRKCCLINAIFMGPLLRSTERSKWLMTWPSLLRALNKKIDFFSQSYSIYFAMNSFIFENLSHTTLLSRGALSLLRHVLRFVKPYNTLADTCCFDAIFYWTDSNRAKRNVPPIFREPREQFSWREKKLTLFTSIIERYWNHTHIRHI